VDGEEPKGGRHPQPDIKKGVESYSNFRMLKYGQLCKTLTLLNCFFHVLFLMSFIYIYILGWSDKPLFAGEKSATAS
jgi:hypothetical protein